MIIIFVTIPDIIVFNFVIIFLSYYCHCHDNYHYYYCHISIV